MKEQIMARFKADSSEPKDTTGLSEPEAKERRRLLQKKARAQQGSAARNAMLNWNRSEKGKAAASRHRAKAESREKDSERRKPGTPWYEARQERLQKYIHAAEKRKHEWTAKDQRRLLEMKHAGMKTKDIAAELSRSIKGVEHMYARLTQGAIHEEGRMLTPQRDRHAPARPGDPPQAAAHRGAANTMEAAA